MDYPCGGNGICGKCVIRFLDGRAPEPNEAERRRFTEQELAKGFRLACQSNPGNAPYQEMQQYVLPSEQEEPAAAGDFTEETRWGVAVDLGTTTVALALVDLTTAEVKGSLTLANPQSRYGADVMSRMQQANAGYGRQLQEVMIRCLEQGVEQLLPGVGEKISSMVIAANTTMCHLLRGLSCETLGQAPFVPVECSLAEFVYRGVSIYVLPQASAFIGGDILAGLFALDALDWQKPRLFLDLGTNGEMVLWNGRDFFATSAAAGPALEGGNISCGVAGIYGAICDVTVTARGNRTTTIGGVPAIGLCGSGLLAAISGMRRNGILDEHWILRDEFLEKGYPFDTPGSARSIRLTQEDIRQFLLARSAIVSGYEILMETGGISPEDLKEVVLAGGLGNHLKVSCGVDAGLFPRAFGPKIRNAGNTSLQGAIRYLLHARDGNAAMEELARRLQILSLAEHPKFHDKFIRNLE
jgi:uncharacterized 2Fe-2S/4Fe-4S cluster protein (DUF4445 family)